MVDERKWSMKSQEFRIFLFLHHSTTEFYVECVTEMSNELNEFKE